MAAGPYRYPLAVQLTLPDGYRGDLGFGRVLALLQRLGFSGVELNIRRPEEVDPEELKGFLARYGLSLYYLATGATAKAEGLSLSDPDEEHRARAVRRCRTLIEYAAHLSAGIIVGFLKGPPAPDREQAHTRMGQSLRELVELADRRRAAVLLEATNRYESAVANTLEEAASLVAPLGSPRLQILPDTFHMNIEESDMYAALQRQAPHYRSLHLSDNNRLLPGLGALDFAGLIARLQRLGYRGRLALEGNIRGDLLGDLEASMRFLAPLLRGPG
jgi:D-psicose/D-tagatose/L-ribulose 3-epimerase